MPCKGDISTNNTKVHLPDFEMDKTLMKRKMNKTTAITLIASALTLSSASAANNTISKEIAPYVYPQNRAATPPGFTYAADGNGYFMLSADGKTIDRYDIKSGNKIETIFDVDRTRETMVSDIEGFEVSANGRYILVYRDSEPIYRRSFTASYYIYEVRTRLMQPLSADFQRQRAPLMTDDGRMVAFVGDDNNIYIKKVDYNSQVAVTKDGEVNKVLNGVPDWVYEEEFTTSRSMVWSPDNLQLCYLRYDESEVPTYTLPIYEGTCHPRQQYSLYPGTYSYKYPVAGAPNSKVSLHAYDVETRKATPLPLPDPKIEYIPRIAFGSGSDCLMVSTLNRDQNHFEIYNVNPRSTVAKSVYTDKTKAWVEEMSYDNIIYGKDYFIVMSGKSGYNHLYKYSYSGALQKTLTQGDFDVTQCYGYDAAGNFYYQAAHPTPMDRVVYCISAKGVTSAISPTSGTNSADFAPDMSVAMMSHSDVTTPPVYTINTASGKKIRTVLDNAEWAQKYSGLPVKEFFTMTSDGVTLNGYMIKPAGASASNKCPVIMSQYSGPGSQQVLNRWGVDWEQYFVKQGYGVICVDGRGTGGRGHAFMDVVYRQLGHYETIDQVNAAKYAASLPWVDASRIGIYGWSYGGYEALMAASQAGAPYSAAVSIAPVTDWRFYDSIYTERYMLTPQQNATGYDQSSAIARTGKLVCPVLLMYGTSDDNVHPVNTLQYVSTLQSQGGLCDMFVFPNMNHSINGCNARAVVYAKMMDYFNKTLRK